MKNSKLLKHAAAIGIFAVLFYILCLIWRKFIPTDPELARLHLMFLKLSLPGFRGYDTASLIWGGLLSFVYGFIASLVFHALHRNCCGAKE